jgi:glucan phosphoethanolaminetransferase (alkaline phosphatase superfamily)
MFGIFRYTLDSSALGLSSQAYNRESQIMNKNLKTAVKWILTLSSAIWANVSIFLYISWVNSSKLIDPTVTTRQNPIEGAIEMILVACVPILILWLLYSLIFKIIENKRTNKIVKIFFYLLGIVMLLVLMAFIAIMIFQIGADIRAHLGS